MSIWDLCICEIIRTSRKIPQSQEATEAWVELTMLEGYPIVAKKQHLVVND